MWLFVHVKCWYIYYQWHNILQLVVQPVGWPQVVRQPAGWIMSPAKPRLIGPAKKLMTSLGCAQQGGCVDSRRHGTFDRNSNQKRYSYLCIFTLGSIWSWGVTKIRSTTKLYSICLFLYRMNIKNVSSSSLCLQCFEAVGWAAGRASGL